MICLLECYHSQHNSFVLLFLFLELYDEIAVKELYLRIFNSSASPYEMISFLQHANFFSPSLDFTIYIWKIKNLMKYALAYENIVTNTLFDN